MDKFYLIGTKVFIVMENGNSRLVSRGFIRNGLNSPRATNMDKARLNSALDFLERIEGELRNVKAFSPSGDEKVNLCKSDLFGALRTIQDKIDWYATREAWLRMLKRYNVVMIQMED